MDVRGEEKLETGLNRGFVYKGFNKMGISEICTKCLNVKGTNVLWGHTLKLEKPGCITNSRELS